MILGSLMLAAVTVKSGTTPVQETLQADPQRLESTVRRLAGWSPPRNCRRADVMAAVAGWLNAEFGKNGERVRVTRQDFIADGKKYENVIASLGREQGPRFVIGAHYDVHGDLPGADDNASGVAALLELARLLAPVYPARGTRLDLVAWANEEPPFFGTPGMGSSVHARRLAASGVRVLGAVSLEMLGYFSDEPGSQRFPDPRLAAAYPDRGNFILVAGRPADRVFVEKFAAALRRGCPVPVEEFSTALVAVEAVSFSDHRNYWAAGFPALMLTDTAFLRNPHYHTAGDTPETLDYTKLAGIVSGLARMLAAGRPGDFAP
jgi:hypothetical protein